MTELTAAEMQSINGEGFWDGFRCGAAAAIAIGATFTPEPVSKIALASAWTAAVGTCAIAFF
jgi:hypothetical protein